jgi:hypothetical protein
MARFWMRERGRVSYSAAPAQGDDTGAPGRYFVTRDELALPVAFRSGEMKVYVLARDPGQ